MHNSCADSGTHPTKLTAWMGMPVQWKANGKSEFFPLFLSNCALKTALVRLNAWPRWRCPLLYGYGNVTMNLSSVLSPVDAS